MSDLVYPSFFNENADNKPMSRTDIINHFIKKYNYKSYLEIGVQAGYNITAVACDKIHGVDPDKKSAANFKITSDEFFAMIRPEVKYDIIFIDGLHLEDQVMKDIENSLNHLSVGGTIVMHDCNPPTEWHQRSYEEFLRWPYVWNGTTWRAFVRYRATRPDLIMYCVDTDWGCGIIRLGNGSKEPHVQQQETISLPEPFTYQQLTEFRESWLNMITTGQFKALY